MTDKLKEIEDAIEDFNLSTQTYQHDMFDGTIKTILTALEHYKKFPSTPKTSEALEAFEELVRYYPLMGATPIDQEEAKKINETKQKIQHVRQALASQVTQTADNVSKDNLTNAKEVDVEGLTYDQAYVWRWIERAIWQPENGALSILKHCPHAPWNNPDIEWDTSHKEYDAEIKAIRKSIPPETIEQVYEALYNLHNNMTNLNPNGVYHVDSEPYKTGGQALDLLKPYRGK